MTTELTSDQVLEYLRDNGRTIKLKTWWAYVGRNEAPRPTRHILGRVPVWDADEIRLWQTDRGAWRAKYRAEAQTDPT